MKLLSRTLAVKTYEMIYEDTWRLLLVKSRKFNTGIEISVRWDSDIVYLKYVRVQYDGLICH